MEPSLYSSTDIIRATRVCTYRQLDYWARTDVVTPSIEARGSGSQRAYTLDEIVNEVKGYAKKEAVTGQPQQAASNTPPWARR